MRKLTLMTVYVCVTNFLFSQIAFDHLPIDFSITYKESLFVINIKDSIDGANIYNEPIDNLNYSQTIIELKKDSLLNCYFRFPSAGFLPVNSNESKVKNQLVKFNLKKKSVELFVYFEINKYGPKMYLLKGYFKNYKKGNYSDFVPKEINIIRSGKNERCYFFNKNGNKVIVSDVLKDKYVYFIR